MKLMAPLLIGIWLFCFLSAGCLANAGIGEITYENSAFHIPIEVNDRENILVQVLLYDVSGLHQEEVSLIIEEIPLIPGQTTMIMPAPLPEGNYKAHITLFHEGKRLAGRILDFHVDFPESP